MSEATNRDDATPATGDAGRGRGNAGRGAGRNGGRGTGRGRGRGHQHRHVSSFRGNTKGMNGHVFQVFNERENKQQFTKTVEMLQEYAIKELDYASDLYPMFNNISQPELEDPPEEPKDKNNATRVRIWERKIDKYVEREIELEENLKKIFVIIWGQCSDAMRAKITANDEYESKARNGDCVWLLTTIRAISNRFEGEKNIFLAIDDARSAIGAYRQAKNQTNHEYYVQFKYLVDAFESYGGSIGVDPILIKEVTKVTHPDHISEDLPEDIKNDKGALDPLATLQAYKDYLGKRKKYLAKKERESRNRALAIAFLKRADRARYGNLMNDLSNQFTQGSDRFPLDLAEAFSYLQNYRPHQQTRNHNPNRNRDEGNVAENEEDAPPTQGSEVGFLQATPTNNNNSVPGTDGRTHDVRCYRCQQWGHYALQCPTQNENENVQMVQVEEVALTEYQDPVGYELSFAQIKNSKPAHTFICKHWLLLDSQSSISVFNNETLVQNIRNSYLPVKVHTNGGEQESYQFGDTEFFGSVWFNPASLANILSLAQVRKYCRVTMDTRQEPAMIVHLGNGKIMKFKEYTNGLYFYDTREDLIELSKDKQVTTSENVTDYSLMQSVEENKQLFTHKQLKAADAARELSRKLGRPSKKNFECIIATNLINNCPITLDDVRRAELIYGPDIATLKGHTTKKPGSILPHLPVIPLPANIIKYHLQVTLAVDVLYIQGYTFLHTYSKETRFRTITQIANRKIKTLSTELNKVIHIYHSRGFEIIDVHADIEFEPLREPLRPIQLHTVAKDDHVTSIERSIRTVKEDTRTCVHGLPFSKLPKMLLVDMVKQMNRNLNQFPAKDGISKTLSPMTLLTGAPKPDFNKL